MTAELEYYVLDVFAARPFAGNPLAVVLDGDRLTADQMQVLAREFQLSETAFPLAPDQAEPGRGVDYRLRIFTPMTELPFAGHPSVGTAWLLAQLGRLRPGRVVQACGAGDLILDVPGDGGPVELTGGPLTCSEPLGPQLALSAVGLTEADLADPHGLPVRVCGTGLDYAVLAVTPQALDRCRPDLTALATSFAHPHSAASGVYVTNWDVGSGTARARMFAGDLGSPEDAATGSAALALGVWLDANGRLPGTGGDRVARFTVRQGELMGRPSLLSVAVHVVGGRATEVRVTGQVVQIAHGWVTEPPAAPAPAR